MVAKADTGARNAGPFAANLIFGLCIAWSLFQLYIASKVPGVLAQATGISIFANIVAQARFVHLAFAIALATLAFPIFGHRNRIPWYDWTLVVLGVSSCLYLVIFRFEIADRPGLWSTSDIVMSGHWYVRADGRCVPFAWITACDHRVGVPRTCVLWRVFSLDWQHHQLRRIVL
jgi:TRAP-type uncharacterized transport system fused permease subunit